MQEIADQDNKASSPLSLEVEAKLKEFDERVERLTDLYIAKDISREEYHRKKSAILHDKMALKGALDKARTAISGGWLEPAKRFLTTCNSAGSVAWQGNPAVQKDFLRIFGSNFLLKDRNLLFQKTYPFIFIKKASLRSMWLRMTGQLSDYFRGSPEVEIQKFLTCNVGSSRLRPRPEPRAAAAASSPECRSS